MEAKFILGSEPLSNFDAYVQKIQSLGIDQLLAVYQKTYDNSRKSAGK
jgi:putative aldouronate transport system substrate-binding protein